MHSQQFHAIADKCMAFHTLPLKTITALPEYNLTWFWPWQTISPSNNRTGKNNEQRYSHTKKEGGGGTKTWCRRKETEEKRGKQTKRNTQIKKQRSGDREKKKSNLSLAVRHWPLKYLVEKGVRERERERQRGWSRERDRESIMTLHQRRIKASLSCDKKSY